MEIFKMTESDLNYLTSHLNEYDNFWTSSILKSEFSNSNSTYLVIKEKNDILGFGGIWFGYEEVHITNIAIRKD